MSVNAALAHLKDAFPDRMVLGPRELAKVLGRSEKAVRHLIEREKLPFAVKRINRSVVVDIFQVAQWLGSVDDEPFEVATPRSPKGEDLGAPPGKTAGRRNRSRMSIRLMEAVHELSRVLDVRSRRAESGEAMQFCTELGIALIKEAGHAGSEFAVTLRSWSEPKAAERSAMQRAVFQGAAEAERFARDQMAHLSRRLHDGQAGATLSIRTSDACIFRAHWLPRSGWTVTDDTLGRHR